MLHRRGCTWWGGGEIYREPDSDVGISGIPRAASILLITEGFDNDRVIERAYYNTLSANLIRQWGNRKPEISHAEKNKTDLCGMNPEASCRRCRRPASYPRSPIVRDPSPARGPWGWFQGGRRGRGGRPTSGFLFTHTHISAWAHSLSPQHHFLNHMITNTPSNFLIFVPTELVPGVAVLGSPAQCPG